MAVSSVIEIFDRFGVALGMLVLFVLATMYILRRLLHEKKGILTGYVENTIEQQKQLTAAVTKHAENEEKLVDVAGRMESSLNSIKVSTDHLRHIHRGEHSRFSNLALARAFRHGCDVLREIADKLELKEQCEPLLDKMQQELDVHLTINNEHQDEPPLDATR